jgi:hypothetical protein
MSRANCLIFALRLWWRRGGIGGIRFRRSRLAPSWVPHFMYVEVRWYGRVRIVQFVPDDTSPLPWWRVCRVGRFHGHVKWGDR